jgi:hypothetical protein
LGESQLPGEVHGCYCAPARSGALFQRREPHGGRSRLRTWATTSPDRLPRRLRPNAGRDVLGSNAGIRPCARAGRSDRSAARWVGSGRPGKPGRLRRKSNLEGDTSPWKERAFQVPARVPDATDPFAEQRLEVEGSTRQTCLSPTSNGERGASPSGGVQRHGGTGRGDTVRLWAGGTLRRVEIASRGRGLPHPGCSRLAFGLVASPRKRCGQGVPRERVSRNAANLRTGCGMQQARGPSRRENRRGGAKPRGRNGSWTGGAVGPKVSRGNSGRWEWTRGSHVGGGATGHEPQERKGLGPRSELRLWSAWPRGARPVCGRFEGDGRSRRADDGPYRSPATLPVMSSRAPDR